MTEYRYARPKSDDNYTIQLLRERIAQLEAHQDLDDQQLLNLLNGREQRLVDMMDAVRRCSPDLHAVARALRNCVHEWRYFFYAEGTADAVEAIANTIEGYARG